MAYSIVVDDHERFEIKFHDEPSYVRGFRMAPESREMELNSGDWFVLVFAIWSVDDRPAIDEALAVAHTYGGRFKLAVRPFELANELNCWLGGAMVAPTDNQIVESKVDSDGLKIEIHGNKSGTPFWFLLRDGKLIAYWQGPMQRDDLKKFVASGFGVGGEEGEKVSGTVS